MKNLTTVSRLACLTIVLAAGTMMAPTNIATAKDNHHQSNNVQNNGHQRGTMSGRPAGVKTALREQIKCMKHCGKPTQPSTDKNPTTTSPKPAVSDQPATAKSAASSPPTTSDHIEWRGHLRHIQRQRRPDRNGRKPDEHHGDEQQS
ncbi:MAG TPA: hypothetical protein VFI94_20140 [Pseudolabrys sp.]|nr:hypothetical protein [Pseudolabrys sp.]